MDTDGTSNAVLGPAGGEGLFTQGTMLQVCELSCVVQRFLTSGGHANVYLTTLMRDGSTCVLKHIPFGTQADDDEHRRRTEQEISFMTQLRGQANIVTLEAAEMTDDGAFILMEHCTGDVLSLMNEHLAQGLSEATIVHIFSDVCKAVAHMHYQDKPLLHRDLKAENVLQCTTNDGDVYKLCDFGSTTSAMVAANTRVPREQILAMEEEIQRMTTLEYRAPEMVDLYLRRGIGEAADIWALGVLLYKLCYFKTPFDNASSLAILNVEYSIPPTPVYSKRLCHIFQMTLREEPRERCNIYTLYKHVCQLRGEPCHLENKYASPPISPTSASPIAQRDGLGYVSAQPAHLPKRYAASSSRSSSRQRAPMDSSRPNSGTNSELDSDGIVPMRRGRPKRQANNYAAATAASTGFRESPTHGRKVGSPASTGGRLALPDKQSALRQVSAAPPAGPMSPVIHKRPEFRGGIRNSSTQSRGSIEPLRSAPIRHQSEADSGDALGIYGQGGVASLRADLSAIFSDLNSTDDAKPSDDSTVLDNLQHIRMSTVAPNGRESLSADFVQGAVFGSARRASVLRRNPSVRSTASSASSQLSHQSSLNRNGAVEPADGPVSAPVLGRRSLSSGSVAMGRGPRCSESTYGAKEAQAKETKPEDESALVAMITPLSLQTASPDTAPASSDSVSLIDPASPTQGHGFPDELSPVSRLSTILESYNDDSINALASRPAQAERQHAPLQSIYEMTLDKLEDELSISTPFDEQPMFSDAKAKYAAQRSSVYQGPATYSTDAQNDWDQLPAHVKGGMLQVIDELSGRDRDSSLRPDSSIFRSASAEDGDAVDIDTVLQRAGRRNRQKLEAQNRRRTLYMAEAAAAGASEASILPEDVDDGMHILTEQEMDELLSKMDMYNHELLTEQQRWQQSGSRSRSSTSANTADMASLDHIIECANDRLLREEQSSVGLEKSVPGRALQSAISAAKHTLNRPSVAQGDLPQTKLAVDTTSLQAYTPRGDSEETVVSAAPATTTVPAEKPAPVAVDGRGQTAVTAAACSERPKSAEIPDSPVDVGHVPDTEHDGGSKRQPEEPRPAASPKHGGAKTTVPPASTAGPANSRSGAVSPVRCIPSSKTGPTPADPLAEARMRIKKKQSSPSLTPAPAARRAAFLKASPPPPAPRPSPAAGRGKGPSKSVRNLVAMFDK